MNVSYMTKEELLKALEEAGIDPSRLDKTRYIGWSVEDVQSEEVRPDLNDDEALDVLERVVRKHDATFGVNWDTLKSHADYMYPINQST